jgi:pimeloyl-ACP methyl ester carboxylesterase
VTTFLLIPGSWLGGWCWARVAPGLEAAGHRVIAPTLPGLAERASELSASISLGMMISDIKATVERHGLDRFVLVGHSYAGLRITLVAASMPERIVKLIYHDAIFPLPGESWASQHPDEIVSDRRKVIAASATRSLTAIDPRIFGVDGDDRAWMLERQTEQPAAFYEQPAGYNFDTWSTLPRAFVECTSPATSAVDRTRSRISGIDDWTIRSLPTGHYPMVTMPEKLTAVLIDLAIDRP